MYAHERQGSSCICVLALPKDRNHHVLHSLHSQKTRIIMYSIPCTSERLGSSQCICFHTFRKDRDHVVFVSTTWIPKRPGSSCTRSPAVAHERLGLSVFGSIHSQKTKIIVYLFPFSGSWKVYLIPSTHERPGFSCIWFFVSTENRDHRVFDSLHSQKTRSIVYLFPCTPERLGSSVFCTTYL